MSLTKRVTRGAAVLIGMRHSIRLIGLASTAVLARVLVPDDFGLVALAVSYLAILEGVTAVNLNSVLIRIRDDSRDLYDTAWTIGLIRGTALSVLVMLSSLFLPALMDEPRLEAVILDARPLCQHA